MKNLNARLYMLFTATMLKGATNLAPSLPTSVALQPVSKASAVAVTTTAVLGAISWPLSMTFGAAAAEISVSGDNFHDTDNNTL